MVRPRDRPLRVADLLAHRGDPGVAGEGETSRSADCDTPVYVPLAVPTSARLPGSASPPASPAATTTASVASTTATMTRVSPAVRVTLR